MNTRITGDDEEGRSGEGAWIEHAVREIQAGRDEDHAHFGAIFKHYEPRCLRLLRSLGLKRDLDDLVQVVMLQVYRGLGEYRLESSFDTWFISIVMNAARNARRDRSTQKVKATEASLDFLLDSSPEAERPFPEPRDDDPGPLEVTLGAERGVHLEALLRELPPKMRQSMLLYYLHGYQQSEIAELQGNSVHTVKKQLVEARKRVRPLFSVFAELFGLLLVVFLLVG